MSAKNIRLKLGEIERRIENAEKEVDMNRLVELQVEHQILQVYLEVLETSKADPDYLSRKGLILEIRDELLNAIPTADRVEIVCMVKGTCGV